MDIYCTLLGLTNEYFTVIESCSHLHYSLNVSLVGESLQENHVSSSNINFNIAVFCKKNNNCILIVFIVLTLALTRPRCLLQLMFKCIMREFLSVECPGIKFLFVFLSNNESISHRLGAMGDYSCL